jgi:protein-L-isoaspartate(D-aspartate) O-methyltransferase
MEDLRQPSDEAYDRERRTMVETQLARRDIKDARVLKALGEVPRHRFVPKAIRHAAYHDRPLAIGSLQTISQPYMVAAMTQELGLAGGERVLEIGTGSGYQTAILATLCERVYTIERHASLAEKARKVLNALGCQNIRFRTADGSMGWAEEAPFDRILVTAGAPAVPEPLKGQLGPGGILVVPVGQSYHQSLITVVRTDKGFREHRGMGCVFVRLIGRDGWEE